MVLKIRGTDGAWTYYGEVTSLTASESGSWVKEGDVENIERAYIDKESLAELNRIVGRVITFQQRDGKCVACLVSTGAYLLADTGETLERLV